MEEIISSVFDFLTPQAIGDNNCNNKNYYCSDRFDPNCGLFGLL